MVLTLETEAQPCAYISLDGTGSLTYLALTVFTWLLLTGSLAFWLVRAYRLMRGQGIRLPDDLPWLLYAGYAFQLVASIRADFAGALGSNVQLRVLPATTLISAVMFARGLAELSVIACGVGVDERLRDVMPDDHSVRRANTRDIFIPERQTQRFLVSEAERARALRTGLPLPETEYEDRLYDNGLAQLFRVRPVTPYQRWEPAIGTSYRDKRWAPAIETSDRARRLPAAIGVVGRCVSAF